MNEEVKRIAEKKDKIMNLLIDVFEPELYYFDIESNAMLDEKIEVLQALKDGKTIGEIPNFHKILELMPQEGLWD